MNLSLESPSVAVADSAPPDAARFAPPLLRTPPRRYPDRFTVKSEGSYIFLRFAEIDWIEAQGDYVKFHAGPRSCLARMTMKAVEESIDPAKFLRVHRSTFVNIDRIEKISPYRDRQYAVFTHDGTRLRVGGAYWARLKELYVSGR